MHTKRASFAVFLIGLLLAGTAFGHSQGRSDADDSPDRLDIKQATISHTSRRIKIDVRTWQTWATSELQSGKRTIWFTFDTKGGNAADYGVNILKTDSGLTCIVGTEPDGARVAEGRANRDSRNHVSCSFGRKHIEAGGSNAIRWKGSMFNLETFERDYVPDSGMVRHSL